MDPSELLLTSARAVAVYALILIVIRLLGKRTVGNFTAFDLLIALMLGELVDEMIYGDVRFLQGTVAIVTLAALAAADSWVSYASRGMQRVLEGTPTVIVRDGTFDRDGMRAERMNERDVMGMLRLSGIQDIREVHLAIVETDGKVSVLKHDWAAPADKADVDETYKRRRDKALDGREKPPPGKQTDSPHALGED
ncbi:MAG TPA: YetF domain-containing protein [Vicinamibacterales bacterium]|jgi:uncharacterized membrane protein YcaP (DUF421 family)|nr:YetF domain-containing protein [Vicinamibacterales bacterium]HEX2442774.1 YetF domain-containing protein [Vicinamibacterales bacterium]